MIGNNYIVIPRKEWERMNRWKYEEEEEKDDHRKEYFKQLVEKSQNWIKTWPDTAQGHVEKLARDQKRIKKDNIAFVKAFMKKKAENKFKDSLAEIKEARQIIFEKICYGQKLLSALYESKNLEEREVQLQFKAKIQQEAKKLEEDMEKAESFLSKIDKQDTEVELKKRQVAEDIANINYCVHKTKLIEEAKRKSELVKEDLENAELNKKYLEYEEKQQKAYEECMRRDIKEYEEQQKKWRARREEGEKCAEARAAAQRKEKDIRDCRIKQVMKEIHKDNRESEQARQHYKLIENIENAKKVVYEEFLEAGIKRREQKYLNDDQEELLNEKLKREKCIAIAQENKKTAEVAQLCPCRIENKCVCDRQTIMCRSKGKQGKASKEVNGKSKNARKCVCCKKSGDKSVATFMQPRNKLLDALKKREKEPSPWSGLQASHAMFAEEAGKTLKECKYKIFARKVVDEYRKINGLDAKTLPVENY